MEEAIAERPTSQELQINQRLNGSVGPSDTKCPEEPSYNGYASRQTDWSRTHVPSGSFEGNILPQDKGRRSVCHDFNRGQCPRGRLCKYEHCLLICRDFVRGNCTYGESCKFWHSESDKHDGNRPSGSENLGNFANLGTPQFDGGNKDDNLKSSIPRERKSTAPCWKFLSGRCFRGSDCAYSHSENSSNVRPWNANLQQGVVKTARDLGSRGDNIEITVRTPREHDGGSKENDPNARPNFGQYRSRSPCRNFLRGRCNNGANCRHLHIENTGFVRPRNDGTSYHQEVTENSVNLKFDKGHVDVSLRTSQENNEVKKDLRNHCIHRGPRSRSHCRKFLRGSCMRGSSCPYMHPSMHDQPKFDYSTDDVDLGSRNRCSHGQRTRTHIGEFGNGKQIKEFCLKFAKGRCDRGDSCRYLHSFHEYAKSNHVPCKERHSENIVALGSSDGVHCHVGNSSCLSDDMHTVNDSVSQDGAFDEQSKRSAVDDSSNPNVLDQKGEPQVIDGKEADEDISLWSQPFKRQRSWSESPFTHKDDFSRRSARRDGFQSNFMRDRNCNLAPFQYHHRSSYHRSWSRYHLDNRPHSKVTTSMDLPSRQVDKDSNTEVQNQNSDCELAKDEVQLNIVEKCDTPSGNLHSDSHLTNTQVMSSNGMRLDQCGAGSLDSNNSSFHQNIDISKGQIGASPKEVEFLSTSPECDTSLRNNGGEASISLSQEGGETSEDMETHSRKRRKITCVKCHADSFQEALTDPTMHRLSCDCSPNTSLSCANNVSITGASNEEENGETPDIIQDKVEPVPAVMETSGSLIKEANLNFKGKLLILDVNGILADIVVDYPEAFKPDTVVSMKGVFKRPFCDDFLDFCFERFDVGVWSSRNKKNVDKVTDFLLGDSKKKLLFCWDQSHCTDTGYKTVENRSKPLVLKELRRLWEKQVDDLPWEKGYYNETNTILLDDSPYKALRNPPYTAVFPFPFTFRDCRDTDLGPNGKLRLYLERLSEAENVRKFIQENPFGQRPITKSNLSWRFYSKIIGDYSTHNQDNANGTSVAS